MLAIVKGKILLWGHFLQINKLRRLLILDCLDLRRYFIEKGFPIKLGITLNNLISLGI